MPSRAAAPPIQASPPRRRALALLGLPLLAHAAAALPARTLVVGAGQRHAALRTALAEARDGDTVELLPGDYRGDVGLVTQQRIVIRGRAGGAVLHADGASIEGKAILVVRGDATVENVEFRGARVAAGNGAGIRFERGRLALRNCRFFDNEMGVLTANESNMALDVSGCTFGAAPRDDVDLHHLIYVGRIGSFRLAASHVGGGWRGHLVKSRALRNRLENNRIDDGPDGEASYEIDFPEGGDNVLVGNVVAQSRRTQNPTLLSVGAEGKGLADARLVLGRNTFFNGAGVAARFVHVWADRLGAATAVRMAGNLFAGPGRLDLPRDSDGGNNHRIDVAQLRDPLHGDFRLVAGSALAGRAGAPG